MVIGDFLVLATRQKPGIFSLFFPWPPQGERPESGIVTDLCPCGQGARNGPVGRPAGANRPVRQAI